MNEKVNDKMKELIRQHLPEQVGSEMREYNNQTGCHESHRCGQSLERHTTTEITTEEQE